LQLLLLAATQHVLTSGWLAPGGQVYKNQWEHIFMESLLPLIIQAVGGAVGGNVGGAAMKNSSLGGLGNTIAGAVGGLAGGNILGSLSRLWQVPLVVASASATSPHQASAASSCKSLQV
jgi:uncharacterized membrane protein YeaQ/YmgE (transglycosylase-associated protein family)